MRRYHITFSLIEATQFHPRVSGRAKSASYCTMPTAPLEGFTKLDDITSIYHPPECTKLSAETKSKAPCLIVICSWMGAAPKHIFKYIDGYRHLCPTASILLIESTLSRMFIGSDLTAACEIINSFVKNESSQSNSGTGPHAVLHCYSNGGTYADVYGWDVFIFHALDISAANRTLHLLSRIRLLSSVYLLTRSFSVCRCKQCCMAS